MKEILFAFLIHIVSQYPFEYISELKNLTQKHLQDFREGFTFSPGQGHLKKKFEKIYRARGLKTIKKSLQKKITQNSKPWFILRGIIVFLSIYIGIKFESIFISLNIGVLTSLSDKIYNLKKSVESVEESNFRKYLNKLVKNNTKVFFVIKIMLGSAIFFLSYFHQYYRVGLCLFEMFTFFEQIIICIDSAFPSKKQRQFLEIKQHFQEEKKQMSECDQILFQIGQKQRLLPTAENEVLFSDVLEERKKVKTETREPQDYVCLILFIIVTILFLILVLCSNISGNPVQAYRATDGEGNICGQQGGVAQNFKQAYIFNPKNSSQRYCVNHCPEFKEGSLTNLSCYGVSTCRYAMTINQRGEYSSQNTTTGILGYNSTSMLRRICIPNAIVLQNAFTQNQSNTFTSLKQKRGSSFSIDIENNKYFFLLTFGIAILVGLVFFLLLYSKAYATIMASLVLMGLIFLVVGIPSIRYGFTIDDTRSLSFFNLHEDFSFTYLLLGFFMSFLFLFLAVFATKINTNQIVILCKLAGTIMKEIKLSCILVLICQALVLFSSWFLFLQTLPNLVSIQHFSLQKGDVFTTISDPIQIFIFLLGNLWLSANIQAVVSFVIAKISIIWYFNENSLKDQQISKILFNSLKLALTKHLGSLALGSFLTSIFYLNEIIFSIVKALYPTDSQNNFIQCIIELLQKITSNANSKYLIHIALRGQNYFESSYESFSTLWSNPMKCKCKIVGGVGLTILLLGRTMIVTITTVLAFIVIYFNIIETHLNPFYALLMVFIISWLIGNMILTPYSTMIETIVQCAMVDLTAQKSANRQQGLYIPSQIEKYLSA